MLTEGASLSIQAVTINLHPFCFPYAPIIYLLPLEVMPIISCQTGALISL